MVLNYFEMPRNDIPDEKIWHHPARLEEWFEAVNQRREHGLQPIDEGEEQDMTGNQLTRELLGD